MILRVHSFELGVQGIFFGKYRVCGSRVWVFSFECTRVRGTGNQVRSFSLPVKRHLSV